MPRRIDTPPACLALIPCQHAKKDSESGLWSITNTFTDLHIDGLPVVMPGFDVFITLGRGGADKEIVRLGLIAPDGSILNATTIDADWGPHKVIELAASMRSIKFSAAGD